MVTLLDTTKSKIVLGEYRTVPITSLMEPLLYTRVQEYRRLLGGRMMAIDRDHIKERMVDADYFVSRKIDGEFNVLVVDSDDIFLINPGGTVRCGLPFMSEVRDLLKKQNIEQALLAGELYVARNDKKRPRVHDVVQVARKPETKVDLERLRFAVFDLVEINRKVLNISYRDVWELIKNCFADGVGCHPVETVELSDIRSLENQFDQWVGEEGAEGVVARSEEVGTFKIKPRHSLDLVIVGFTEGIDDRIGLLHDMLLAVMREEGTFHLLGRVGGGFSEEERRKLLSDLKDITVSSEYSEINADRVAYLMVEPLKVVEISCLDIISQTTRGGTIDRMVLNWDNKENQYKIVRRMPLASIISPQFVRLRNDKTVQPSDVPVKQISTIVDIPMIEKNSLQFSFPKSELIKREVRTRVLKGATMVRKLLLWKTNKETESPDYPAYVLYYTDFSPNRKNPLDRDIRVSNSKQQIDELWDQFLEKCFVKGWQEVRS